MPDPLNAVVDLSHHNGTVDLQQAKGDGIIGVIHKATQGLTGLDPMYQTNKAKAADAGLLWGAYHFATGGDGVEQAQHFLDVVGSVNNTLLVLDFEQNPSGSSMSLEDHSRLLALPAAATSLTPNSTHGELGACRLTGQRLRLGKYLRLTGIEASARLRGFTNFTTRGDLNGCKGKPGPFENRRSPCWNSDATMQGPSTTFLPL